MSTELRTPMAWLLLPITGLVMAFILAPLVVAVAMSISDTPYVVFPPRGFTLGWYAKILQDPDFQASLWFSTTLALGATGGPCCSACQPRSPLPVTNFPAAPPPSQPCCRRWCFRR